MIRELANDCASVHANAKLFMPTPFCQWELHDWMSNPQVSHQKAFSRYRPWHRPSTAKTPKFTSQQCFLAHLLWIDWYFIKLLFKSLFYIPALWNVIIGTLTRLFILDSSCSECVRIHWVEWWYHFLCSSYESRNIPFYKRENHFCTYSIWVTN